MNTKKQNINNIVMDNDISKPIKKIKKNKNKVDNLNDNEPLDIIKENNTINNEKDIEKIKKKKIKKENENKEEDADTNKLKKKKIKKIKENIEDEINKLKKKNKKENDDTNKLKKKNKDDNEDKEEDDDTNKFKKKKINKLNEKDKKENKEEDKKEDKDNLKEEKNNKLSPIIKWSGGKSDEIKFFEKYIPKEYNTYIEPFIGGGSVYFYLNPNKAVITDVHTELIDFYTAIKEGKANEIYNFMKENKNEEKTYYKIRDEMDIVTPLDNAKRFYYQRKTCFRGMLRYNKEGKFNIPFGKYKTINYEDLKNKDYEKLLKRTEIKKTDYEYAFKNYNDENNFMFLDPPYDSEFTDYGYCKFGKEEHKKLAELFKKTKIKCLMVIGKTKFIEELYKDYIVEEYDKKYKFKLYAGRIGDEINTKHLIIKNYK